MRTRQRSFARPACSPNGWHRCRRRPSAWSVARAAAVRICAVHCSPVAASRARARRIWSCARARARAPSCWPGSPRPKESSCECSSSSHTIAYAKSGETIADLLALAGAGDGALRLDEHAVVAAIRAEANRLANADEANVERTVQAAQRQLEAIRRVDLDLLAAPLREIGALRLRHPELSLGELAAKCRPPISKAAAHHRMLVLRRLADAQPHHARTDRELPQRALSRGE